MKSVTCAPSCALLVPRLVPSIFSFIFNYLLYKRAQGTSKVKKIGGWQKEVQNIISTAAEQYDVLVPHPCALGCALPLNRGDA